MFIGVYKPGNDPINSRGSMTIIRFLDYSLFFSGIYSKSKDKLESADLCASFFLTRALNNIFENGENQSKITNRINFFENDYKKV